MEVLDFVRMHLIAWPPLAKAAVALALIVGVPPLSKRVRIPSVVGLLLAGVAIGPHGLALIGERHPIADFFADVGKLPDEMRVYRFLLAVRCVVVWERASELASLFSSFSGFALSAP